MIPLHKVYTTGQELEFMQQVVSSGALSGNGIFTHKCQLFFEKKYNFKKTYLTSSCTDALEMCALLLHLQPGDEVILPSYTFVSTANAFEIHGAKLVFCDSENDTPNIDANKIEKLITPKTKAIVVVHYAGIACEMDKIAVIAKKHQIAVIEDAALALDSFYQNVPLGKWGDLSTFSFHETKNITCGEGGLLVINNDQFLNEAEIIWEKGTNRSAFLRGEADQYEWVSKGSSFLASEISAAFLYAQLLNFDKIQECRVKIFNKYLNFFKNSPNKSFKVPIISKEKSVNGSIFYITAENENQANELCNYLKEKGVMAVSHYRPLHDSKYFNQKYKGEKLLNCERFNQTIIRLPIFVGLTDDEFTYITEQLNNYINNQ